MLFGGFDNTIAGIRIRATTPARLGLQFLVAFGLLLAVSGRARAAVGRAARSPVIMFAAMTALAVWLSLGPRFGLYGVLYDHVPGFDGVRVPARYAMIAGLFLAVLAGYGAAMLLQARVSRLMPSVVVVALLAAAVLMEGVAAPFEINRSWGSNEALPPPRVMPRADAPPVYARVAALPQGSVITEFPFGDGAWEIRYVYYAAAHWKPITNGYSGNFPLPYKERVARLQRLHVDPEAAWQSLRAAGTTHVVLHRHAFAKPEDAAAVEAWLHTRGATELARFDDGDMLFTLDF
jgi:hypothetical protein